MMHHNIKGKKKKISYKGKRIKERIFSFSASLRPSLVLFNLWVAYDFGRNHSQPLICSKSYGSQVKGLQGLCAMVESVVSPLSWFLPLLSRPNYMPLQLLLSKLWFCPLLPIFCGLTLFFLSSSFLVRLSNPFLNAIRVFLVLPLPQLWLNLDFRFFTLSSHLTNSSIFVIYEPQSLFNLFPI